MSERKPIVSGAVSRRAALFGGGLVVGAGAASVGWALAGSPDPAPAPAADAVASVIQPDDDLMREHGVLKRVLLCYQELAGTIQAGGQPNAAHVQDAALIVHDFIEGFHEGLEEGYVFPRLLKAGQLTSTVDTLLVQHARGRVITQYLLTHTDGGKLSSASVAPRLAAGMQAFTRMFQVHEAREDTVVFPAFRALLTPAEIVSLGEEFASLETQQFHADEFTAMVNQVADIEQDLGIYDLDQYTPDITPYQEQE